MNSEEIIGAIYYDRNSVGVSRYTSSTSSIQLTRIRNYTPLDIPKINFIFQRCTTILTNIPNSPLLVKFQINSSSILIISDKMFQDDAINLLLNKLPMRNVNLQQNRKTIIRIIKADLYKYKALGMLLYHLINGKMNIQKIFFQDIKNYVDKLLYTMNIANKDLQFLQVMREEVHPSLIKGKGKSKEGFSLLNVFESYVQSIGGKKILLNIFTNPLYQKQELQKRYELIMWMKENMILANYPKIFKGLCSAEHLMLKFQRTATQEEDWKKLIKLLESLIEIKDSLKDKQNAPHIVNIYSKDSHWEELGQLLFTIKNTIQMNPLSIKNQVDAELDASKTTFADLSNVITAYASQNQWNFQFQVIFMTQIGYLINISKELEQGIIPQDWILQFENTYSHFFSNDLTEKLDHYYGDIQGDIHDREKMILLDLEAYVLKNQDHIVRFYWQASLIECYWGISRISKDMSIPRLSAQSLIIFNGWHPLLGQSAINNHFFSFNQSDPFTPLRKVYNSEQNLVNSNYNNRCMLISGPNGSGKTVYMRQLGIIIYMAHVGLLVPAQFAEIPLCDGIIWLGGDTSCYSQGCGLARQLSDLSSITTTGTITNKTLVLIDELGSSIDYVCSLKLLYATIHHLSSNHPQNQLLKVKGEQTNPLCIVITHLTEMLTSWLLSENKSVRYLTMEVEQGDKFAFKIKPGLVKNGYGIKIAKNILPEQFIKITQLYWEKINENN